MFQFAPSSTSCWFSCLLGLPCPWRTFPAVFCCGCRMFFTALQLLAHPDANEGVSKQMSMDVSKTECSPVDEGEGIYHSNSPSLCLSFWAELQGLRWTGSKKRKEKLTCHGQETGVCWREIHQMFGHQLLEPKERSKEMWQASRLLSPQEVFCRLLIFAHSRIPQWFWKTSPSNSRADCTLSSLDLVAYSEKSNRWKQILWITASQHKVRSHDAN